MSILLERRDYVPDGTGSVTAVEGGGALVNEVLFRLTARRGGFVLLPELGSRMHLLREEKPSRREALARQYAAEALAGLEDVTVTGAAVSAGAGSLAIRVELTWRGLPLSVDLEG